MENVSSATAINNATNTCINDCFEINNNLTNCLEPLLRALGWVGSQRSLIEALPYASRECDINTFIHTMDCLNYRADSLTIDLENLDPRLLPCLFIDEHNHAKVLLEINSSKISYVDGATGKRHTTILNKQSGKIFLFKYDNNRDDVSSIKQNWFWKELSRYRHLMIQVIFISLILAILNIATPIFVMGVYDRVIGTGSFSLLLQFIAGIGIVLIGVFSLQRIQSKIVSFIGARLDAVIGDRVLEKILYLPLNKIETATIGVQVARIKNFDTVREFFTGPLLNVVLQAPFSLIFLAMIVVMTGPLVIIPVTSLVLCLFSSYFLKSTIHKHIKNSAKANATRQEFMLESLNKMSAIKASGVESIWGQRYRDITAEATHCNFRATLLTSAINSISDALVVISGLAIMALCVGEVINGSMTIGAMIATMILMWMVLNPIKSVFANLPRLDQVMISIKQITNLMRMQGEKVADKNHIAQSDLTGQISFQNVSLRYHSQMEPALLGVKFTIKPGEVVAIVGSNGSGKSTLFKLLMRLYTPQAGSIRIDNMDIRQIDPLDLRQSIAYVPQTSHFFYGTIKQNLLLSKPTGSDAEVVAASRAAGVYDDIIALPQGFETRIRDENKSHLSSSLMQRLSLARAYLRKSTILLLDEPASNLDHQESDDLMEMINELRGKSTVMMISHRPSHYNQADRVLFFNKGQLLFNGTPAEIKQRYPNGLPL